MNTKTKEGARNKGNPYFLMVPWNKGGLVNAGPGMGCIRLGICFCHQTFIFSALFMFLVDLQIVYIY